MEINYHDKSAAIFFCLLLLISVIAQNSNMLQPIISLIILFAGIIGYGLAQNYEGKKRLHELREKQDYIDFLEQTYVPSEGDLDAAYNKWRGIGDIDEN